MTKTKLADGIFQYAFPPGRDGGIFGNTIVAIIDGGEAMLIDTAYPEEAIQVKDDLAASGIAVEKIIISHFHSDHYYGVQEFPDIPYYGGDRFEETLVSEGHDEGHIKEAAPKLVVDQPTTIDFGGHILELIPFVGHAVCTLLVQINNQFVFVADDILFTTDGRLMVPWLCGPGDRHTLITRQLAAWGILRQYADYIIIPAHGPAFDGSKLDKYLDSLTSYLGAIQVANGEISYEDAVKGCDPPPLNVSFGDSSWHNHNCAPK